MWQSLRKPWAKLGAGEGEAGQNRAQMPAHWDVSSQSTARHAVSSKWVLLNDGMLCLLPLGSGLLLGKATAGGRTQPFLAGPNHRSDVHRMSFDVLRWKSTTCLGIWARGPEKRDLIVSKFDPVARWRQQRV